MTADPEEKINRTFRLYDETIWIIGFGFLFLTYQAFSSNKSFEQKIYDVLGILFLWVIFLLKTHRIHIRGTRTVIFQGLLRNIVLNPRDILEYQEWVRGGRLVHTGGSIFLWPYIENQGELKSILRSANPQIKFRDISAEGTKTSQRVVVIVIAMFAYFGWLIWSLFQGITNSFK